MRNYFLILAILMTLYGCGDSQKTDGSAIVVSFEPQAWLIKQIAGDDFKIITLLPAGSDPENYQPSISTMKSIGNAKAYFTLGTPGFEHSLAEGMKSNFPDIEIIDVTTGIDKIKGTHERHSHNDDNHGDEDFDPHMLASIRNSIVMARNMASSLGKIYPDKAAGYMESAESLANRLTLLDDSIRNMGIEGKSFVIRHPSLSYFSRDYGLNQIPLQSSGKETSPLRMMRNIEDVRNSGSSVFIMEKEHSGQADKETAARLGLETMEVSLNSSEWIGDMIGIAKEISKK